MAPNGRERRWLIAEGRFQFPAWSPTTNQIATIGRFDDLTGGVFVTADEEDNQLTPLYTDNAPIYLYWRPDGHQVSFIAQHREGLALHLVDPDGASPSDVLTTGQPLYWQWLPDHEQIISHVGLGPLNYLDRQGGRTPTALGQGGRYQAPALSADGRYLGYSEETLDEDRAVVVRDLQTDEPLYRQPHQGLAAMSWNPQANQLAYISPIEEQQTFFGPLHLFDAQTNEARTLVNGEVLAFFWSPDGRSLVYLTVRDSGSQQAHRKAGRVGKTQQQEAGYLTVYFLDVETGAVKPLHTYRPTWLFVSQFLPFFDQYALSHRLWSPDSRHIVLPIFQEDEESGGSNQIAVISVDGGPIQLVTEGVSAFWSYR